MNLEAARAQKVPLVQRVEPSTRYEGDQGSEEHINASVASDTRMQASSRLVRQAQKAAACRAHTHQDNAFRDAAYAPVRQVHIRQEGTACICYDGSFNAGRPCTGFASRPLG